MHAEAIAINIRLTRKDATWVAVENAGVVEVDLNDDVEDWKE